jgi:hypothetical protein
MESRGKGRRRIQILLLIKVKHKFATMDEKKLLKDKSWGEGRDPPTLPSVQFSLLKKTNTQFMLYKRKSCSSILNRVK